MPDRPTARQRDAWLLAAMTVPAVALCAGIGWQWALLGGAISAALYLIQGRARQSGLALRDAVNAVSYTHLDVYKRQDTISVTFVRSTCLPFFAALSIANAPTTSISEMADEMAAMMTSR